MPARRRTVASQQPVASPSVASTYSDDPEDNNQYKLKRQRNNDAVKKTRAKSKETANERKRHVENLRTENNQLEAKIEEKKKNVQCLKDLLLTNVKTEDQEKMIAQILDENSADDED